MIRSPSKELRATDAQDQAAHAPASPLPQAPGLRLRPQPELAARHRGDQPDDPPGALGGAAARPGRRVPGGGRRRSGERLLLRAGRSRRPASCWRRTGSTPSEGNPQFHQQMVYAVAMTTIHNFERALGRADPLVARPSDRSRRYQFVPAPAHLPARAARGQRLLQPDEEGAAVRLLPGLDRRPGRQPARRHGLHLPVARHHRPRDDPRAARRPAPALHRADQPRRPGVPRGVRRHRGAVPALHLRAEALRDQIAAHPRRPARGRTCSASWRSSSARRSAAAAPCATPWARWTRRPASGCPGSRTRPTCRSATASPTPAARSWWRRCSTPS